MVSEDEFLERLVAGIQSMATPVANTEVRWNEKIGGRQFDVVVRFQLALTRYLVVIEVKNHKRRTEAQDVEAFVTKARDKQADKIIFVNKAGYQEGALDVARRHGVELFTVAFDEQSLELSTTAPYFLLSETNAASPPPTLSLGEQKRVNVVVSMVLVYADGQRHEVPSETSQMTYYLQRTACADGRTLMDLINDGLPNPEVEQTVSHRIMLTPAQQITPPDEYFYPAGSLTEIESKVEGDYSRSVEGNVRIEPSAFAPLVIYKNILTGEVLSFPMHMLPLGEERVEPLRFYFMESPLRYFYCAAVHDNLVAWRLVESFQAGKLVRSEFRQDMKYARYYIPVTDPKILERLQHRLRDLDNLAGKKANPSKRAPPGLNSARRT